MGNVGSKTRLLDQILGKRCVRSIGHICSPINMKLGQNVCLDKILVKFEDGSVSSKTRSLGQILEKHCVCARGRISSTIIMKLSQNVCLDEIGDEDGNG